LDKTLTSVYIHVTRVGATCQGIGAGLAGLRMWISFFHAHEKLSIGSIVTPALVPPSTDLDPYPRRRVFLPVAIFREGGEPLNIVSVNKRKHVQSRISVEFSAHIISYKFVKSLFMGKYY
jgi:hypothetical protein